MDVIFLMKEQWGERNKARMEAVSLLFPLHHAAVLRMVMYWCNISSKMKPNNQSKPRTVTTKLKKKKKMMMMMMMMT